MHCSLQGELQVRSWELKGEDRADSILKHLDKFKNNDSDNGGVFEIITKRP